MCERTNGSLHEFEFDCPESEEVLDDVLVEELSPDGCEGSD